jgi:hypothetical protein
LAYSVEKAVCLAVKVLELLGNVSLQVADSVGDGVEELVGGFGCFGGIPNELSIRKGSEPLDAVALHKIVKDF